MGQIYAVVDIETTGTNVKEDQIIQFACTLIENERIIHTFATDINPGKPIPKLIQRLTHLDNRRLADAPYFEDVAETIYHLLSGTVFVAHNVHFDYNFLSKTLKKYGFPALALEAIDTVELAQIFMPTATSFRLNDLVEKLGIAHDRPHQADSDAYVTAQLFLHLTEKMKQLPMDTLRQIVHLSASLSRQTGDYIQKIYYRREVLNESFDESKFFKVGNLVLRKQKQSNKSTTFNKEAVQYPKTKKGKEKFFNHTWQISKEQAKVMNLLYQHFTDSTLQQATILELSASQFTPSLYFLPIEFLTSESQPMIISYASEQFLEEWQRLGEQFSNQFHFIDKTMNYYDDEYYIDLFKFHLSLKQPTDQKLIALYQMMILVWLTETTTGEWKELGLYNEEQAFFKQLACQDNLTNKRPDEFIQADFIRLRNQRLHEKQVILVNHQALFRQKKHSSLFTERFNHILFVEFQYLLENLNKLPSATFNSKQTNKLLDTILEWAKQYPDCLAETLIESLNHFQIIIKLLSKIQQQFFDEWLSFFDQSTEQIWTSETVNQLPVHFYRNLRQLLKAYDEVCQLITAINNQLFNETQYSPTFFAFSQEGSEYAELLQMNNQILHDWFDNWQSPGIHTYLVDDAKKQVILYYQVFAHLHPVFEYLTENFAKLAMIGSGFYLPFDKEYIQRKTQISTKVKRLTYAEEEFSIDLLVPKSGLSIPQADSLTYIDYLSKQLIQLLTNHESCLVIFNSQEVLSGVYQQIHEQIFHRGQEIWAVGVNSSLAKILKRFEAANNPVVFLLTHHLSDGNLGKMNFSKIVIARLPFTNPNEMKTKSYYNYLKDQGLDAFYNEALPQMALRLRRAFDLLNFSKESSFIVLDKRIVTTAYGKKIQKMLPKQLVWQEYLNEDSCNLTN